MAQFGAKRPVFAPIKTTPDGALPTYDYEKKVTIGKLVKADLTVTNASGELYGDDAPAEKVDMFASGSLALETDDYAAAHQKHEKMGCICYENPGMGIYFIEDPDSYWIEIVPKRK